MDPHSTHSRFNNRTPKAGPPSRPMESLPTPKSAESPKMPLKKQPASTTTLIRRPIATNSRIKKDEIFKRDMYLSFVSNALHQKMNGVSDTFDELVANFNSFSSPQQQASPTDAAQIRLWLLALSHVVSRLERTHAALVDAIVNMPWTTLDNATVKSYTVFIGMLISARPEYLSLVLAKIAVGFTYQSGIQALDAGLPSTSSAPLTRRVVYDRLHYLLRHILTLIPTLPSTLQPLLVRHFPHKRQNQVSQTTYIRNLLRVSSYCPELSDKILATIIDRAIQIDVEIQIELEELEEQEDNEEEELFEIDPFDVVIGQEPDDNSSDEDSDDDSDAFSDLSSEADEDFDGKPPVEPPMNVKHIQEMVAKLDAILLLLFEHFDRTRTLSKQNVDPQTVSVMELPPLPPLERTFLDAGSPYIPSPIDTKPPNIPSPITPAAVPQSISAGRPANTKKLPDRSPLRAQFHSLLSIFDRTILRTFKSRYTQFLVFWYSSLDPEFSDVFQGMLVDRALMATGPAIPLPQTHTSNGDGSNAESTTTPTSHTATMTPELTRAAAASYIGSFVSRATFVDREGARRVVGVLCEYLRSHLDGVEADLRAGLGFGLGKSGSSTPAMNANTSATIGAILSSGQHTVFYAVAQAVFLIFCFRWRDLLGDDEEEDELDLELDISGAKSGGAGRSGTSSGAPSGGRVKDKWMPELGVLKRVVSSILNPLKVCSPNVVMQFARVAQATDFVYCYTILETNKRADISLSHASLRPGNPSSSRESLSTSMTILHSKVLCEPVNAELNTFFPFDPYRLPKSNVFIQDVYREWSSVAIDDDEEDDSDEDEEDDEDEEPPLTEPSSESETYSRNLDIPRRGKASEDNDGGLGESLGKMSISPAHNMSVLDMIGR